jgi:alpha-mannosidase
MFASENLARGNGNWFTYFKISDQKVTIKAGDTLEYDVFLDPKNPTAKGGLDIDFGGDTTPLRDIGISDQNGLKAHGDGILLPAVGHWYSRKIKLDAASGETTQGFMVDFEGDDPGRYTQFLKHIEITHADGSETMIYSGGPPPTSELEQTSGYTRYPVCREVPLSRVVSGPDLESFIAGVMTAADRTRRLADILADAEVIGRFVEADPAIKKHVEAAKKLLGDAIKKLDITDHEVDDIVKSARTELSFAAPIMSSYTAHLVGYAHIDFQWLWDWQEAEVASRDTFNQAVKFMGEFPGFQFSQSSLGLYKAVEENYPELFEKVKKEVADGRIELLGGRVCEADTNVIGPESHARQFLYGQRYFRENFGKTAKVGWEPDTFGHTIQMPQILKLSGCDYYFFCRAGKNEPLFWWKGLDGSQVLAFDDTANGSWYDSELQDSQFNPMKSFHDKTGSKDMLYVYGVGNHGGGPTREEINQAERWKKTSYMPKIEYSSAQNFFGSLSKYDLHALPKIDQELNTVFEGCYSSHCEIKKAIREAESWTASAEAVAAVASLNGLAYPKADLRQNWEQICMNEHHDTMGGSGVHEPYDKTVMMLNRVTSDDHDVIGHALETLVQRVTPQKDGVSVLVFNPTGWKRSGWCDTYLVPSGNSPDNPLDPDKAVAVAPDGKSYPVDVLDKVSSRARFWAADVPGYGYRVFHLVNGESSKASVSVRDGGMTLENANLLVKFDKESGCVSSITDKRSNKTIAASGLGRIEEQFELPNDMSAWDIGKIAKVSQLKPVSFHLNSSDDCAEVVFEYRTDTTDGHSSPIKQTFRLDGDSDQVTSKVETDWQEIGNPKGFSPMLRVAFDSGLTKPIATYDVPFGALARPVDGREYPGQKWADLTAGDSGLSVLNDAMYGMSATGSTLRLTLIRSSYSPDPQPNPGPHVWNYAIYPHAGSWQQGGTVRRSDEFNQPMVDATVPYDARGSNPLEWGLLDLSDNALVPTALKGSEDGNGIILRMYDSGGIGSEGQATLGRLFRSARTVNLIEDPIGTESLSGNRLTLKLHPFEIRTIRLDP